MIRTRTLALLAFVGALVSIVPSSAYDLTYTDRAATATVVSDTAGYNAITATTCSILAATGGQCTPLTITNKATTTQYYNVSEDPNGAEVLNYRIGGSAWTSSGRVMAPDPVSVGGTVTITLDVDRCVACGTRSAYFTVEGEKANILNSMETKVKVTIQFT